MIITKLTCILSWLATMFWHSVIQIDSNKLLYMLSKASSVEIFLYYNLKGLGSKKKIYFQNSDKVVTTFQQCQNKIMLWCYQIEYSILLISSIGKTWVLLVLISSFFIQNFISNKLFPLFTSIAVNFDSMWLYSSVLYVLLNHYYK